MSSVAGRDLPPLSPIAGSSILSTVVSGSSSSLVAGDNLSILSPVADGSLLFTVTSCCFSSPVTDSGPSSLFPITKSDSSSTVAKGGLFLLSLVACRGSLSAVAGSSSLSNILPLLF